MLHPRPTETPQATTGLSRLTPIQICARDLRLVDRERYLCCLFLPRREREAAFALYAFYHEVAKTADVVSEAMLGEIRLQWWREALDEIFAGTPRRHPVVQGLTTAVAHHDLPKEDLLRLIDSRQSEIEQRLPASEDGLAAHVVETATPLFELLLRVGGRQDQDLAQQAALAYGLPGILRTAGAFAVRSAGPKLTKEQCQSLAKRTESALGAARDKRSDLPKAARRVLLPLSLAEGHLKRLAAADFDYTVPAFTRPSENLVPGLAFKAITNRY